MPPKVHLNYCAIKDLNQLKQKTVNTINSAIRWLLFFFFCFFFLFFSIRLYQLLTLYFTFIVRRSPVTATTNRRFSMMISIYRHRGQRRDHQANTDKSAPIEFTIFNFFSLFATI